MALPAPFPIPLTPVLSAGALLGRRTPHIAAVTDAAHTRLVTSGRIALALALRAIGIQAGDRVLVPSYHSISMIPPITAIGALPVFYRLLPDASVDLDDAAARAGGARVLVVVNYFGFPQDLAAIRLFCDARGLMMVEDCAHSLFGCVNGRPLGSFGDYSIASSMKFLPTYEGGALVSHRHRLDAIRLRSAGIGFELKAALAAVERGLGHGRLPAAQVLLWLPLKLKTALWSMLQKRRQEGAVQLTPSSSDSSYEFDATWLDKRSALFSRLVLRFAARGRIGCRRRANYLALQEAVLGVSGLRPLFAQLPDDVYPWACPVLADDPDHMVAALKSAGIPLIRFGETLWQGVDMALCPVGVDLSRRVLALPCHQELLDSELARMVSAIRRLAVRA